MTVNRDGRGRSEPANKLIKASQPRAVCAGDRRQRGLVLAVFRELVLCITSDCYGSSVLCTLIIPGAGGCCGAVSSLINDEWADGCCVPDTVCVRATAWVKNSAHTYI